MKVFETLDEIYEVLVSNKRVYLYGAGNVCNALLACLPEKYKNLICGIIVTKKNNNPKDVYGIEVMQYSDISSEQVDYVLITAGACEQIITNALQLVNNDNAKVGVVSNVMAGRLIFLRQGQQTPSDRYRFECRSNHLEKVCIILAGYKDYLYPFVFERIKRFSESDIDICVASSGIYSSDLSKICESNSWSYISTIRNNVCETLNVAIEMFPDAKYLFKLDEDIFVTKDYFQRMFDKYISLKHSKWNVGILSPLIPINGFGYYHVLDALGLISYYKANFGEPKIQAGNDQPIENNPNVARFFWGENNIVPNIDQLDNILSNQNQEVIPCPIRLSIGAILFERDLWESMNKFITGKKNKFGFYYCSNISTGLGIDEAELNTYCMLMSRPIMVSTSVAVGHFAFSQQNKIMKKFLYEHPEKFTIYNNDII